MLEECGLPHRLVLVNIGTGERFKPEFLAISTNKSRRVVALRARASTRCILEYLAEKAGKFLPADLRGKYDVLSWINWQMSRLGPMAG
jgi:GST-like protein